MYGNVAELVLDEFAPDAYLQIPPGAIDPWLRVSARYPTGIRGGHWDAEAPALRSAARTGTHPHLKARDPQVPKSIWYFTDAPWLGFRVVSPVALPSVKKMHAYWNQGLGPEENIP